MDHFNQTGAVIIGYVLGFIGFMFDVPIATLWTAAFGACLGLALKPPTSLKYGALLIFAGAAAVGLIVPFFTTEPPSYPEKSIAFLIALIVIGGRCLLPQLAQDVLKAAGDRFIQLISGWGPKP